MPSTWMERSDATRPPMFATAEARSACSAALTRAGSATSAWLSAYVTSEVLQTKTASSTGGPASATRRVSVLGLQGNIASAPLPAGRTSRQFNEGAHAARASASPSTAASVEGSRSIARIMGRPAAGRAIAQSAA
jgi:hypothetical protein